MAAPGEDAAAAQPAPLLALPGPAFPHIDFSPHSLECGGSAPQPSAYGMRLVVAGRQLVLGGGDAVDDTHDHTVRTANSVWDCAVVLLKYLERIADASWSGRHIVELGAGTGLAGIGLAAALMPIVTASTTIEVTDVELAVPKMAANIALNFPESSSDGSLLHIQAGALDWTKRDADVARILSRGTVDVILLADVVWVTDLIEPLCDTIEALASPDTVVFLAHQSRSLRGDDRFFSRLGQSFSWEAIGAGELDPVFRHPEKITVYRISRKQSP